MARGKNSNAKDKKNPVGANARSLMISRKGISSSRDFADLMSSLMSDLIDGRVTPQVGNATVNAGGKLLKVVELQYKYGSKIPGGGRMLRLAGRF